MIPNKPKEASTYFSAILVTSASRASSRRRDPHLGRAIGRRKIRVNAIAPGHTGTEGNIGAGNFARPSRPCDGEAMVHVCPAAVPWDDHSTIPALCFNLE